jgi:hypothetical protein
MSMIDPKQRRESWPRSSNACASAGERPTEPPFARWPLGVKGVLSREEIDEHL